MNSERQLALDGIRGLSIALVLIFHCLNPLPKSWLTTQLNTLCSSFFLGVDLFFVLSGFLITGILIASKGSANYFKVFYVRRALRIFPPYSLVLLFVFLIYPSFNAVLAQSGVAGDAPYYLVYMQNWLVFFTGKGAAWPGIDHLWSVAIEEQFYMLWPLAIWLTPRRWLSRLCVAVVLLALAFKLALLLTGQSWLRIYVASFSHMDSLAIGGWAACRHALQERDDVPTWLRIAGPVNLVILVGVTFAYPGWKLDSPQALTLLTGAAFVTFIWLILFTLSAPAQSRTRRVFENRALRRLGQISYMAYLIHWVIFWQIQAIMLRQLPEALGDNPIRFLTGLTVIGLTLLIAELSFRYIESPILSLKRHFKYEPSPAARVSRAPSHG